MGQAGDKAYGDGVDADQKDDRDRRSCSFGGLCGGWPERRDHIDLRADEIRGQSWQPIEMTLRPARFDDDVFSLDIAVFS